MKNYQDSAGWIAKLKERYRLAFKSICSKSDSVDEIIVAEWNVKNYRGIKWT